MNKKILFATIVLISFYTMNSFGQASTDTTAKPATPVATVLPMPGMSGPLTVNPHPSKFGDVYVLGVVSGLVQFQNNVSQGDKPLQSDLSNGQIFIQKNTGVLQFFVQVGAYSVPDVGIPYVRSGLAPAASYGVVPLGYLKIAPTENFSVEVGKLPAFRCRVYVFIRKHEYSAWFIVGSE